MVLLAGSVLSSCAGPRDPEASLREHVEELKSRTVPSGAKVIGSSEPKVGEWSAIAKWEFETDWSEAEYRRWVVAQLHGEFGDPKVIESRVVFLGHFNGDTESVSAETISGPAKLHVRVSLKIYPY